MRKDSDFEFTVLGKKINIQDVIDWAVFIIPYVIITYLVLLLIFKSSDLGTFGDFIGGLVNPIFGFCSLLAILYTIRLQIKELSETRKELELSREAHEGSKKALDEQANILKEQKFESTFFLLLDRINLNIKSFIEIKDIINRINRISKKVSNGSYLFVKGNILNYTSESSNEEYENIQALNMIYSEHCKIYSDLTVIFILMYQLLKIIDDANLKDSKKYSNILRACLNSDILILLAINCLREDVKDMYKYKSLIEKFSFLEHMPNSFDNEETGMDVIEFIARNYSEKAFGNSNYFNF